MKKDLRKLMLMIDVCKLNYTSDQTIFNFVEWFKESILKLYITKAKETLEYLTNKLEIGINIQVYQEQLM